MSGGYPADWARPELGDFAKATGGSRFPPAAQGSTEGDYPFYKVSDMNLPGNERFMGIANHWITEATRRKIKAKTFPAGSVIFPKIGAAVATNKKRLLTQESIIDNNVMAVVVEDPKVCDFSYLRFWFETIDLRQLSNNGALPSIPGHRVHSMRVPLPPLSEQKKIAHVLSTVQRAIEAQQRIIQATTELKKALMQKLFTEGLRNEPQKQTEIGPAPKSWEVVKLEAKAESFQYGTSVKCSYDTNGKPVLRIPNVIGGRVDPTDLKFGKPKPGEIGKLSLRSGDLLFVRTNGVKENAGRCSKFNDELSDCYFASYLIRVRLNPTVMSPDFLNEYSRTEAGTSFLSGKAIRTADGKFNINSGTLKAMLVPVPRIDEQNEIARTLALIDARVTNSESKKVLLQDLFRTLLHKLMTAKTRVHEIETTT